MNWPLASPSKVTSRNVGNVDEERKNQERSYGRMTPLDSRLSLGMLEENSVGIPNLSLHDADLGEDEVYTTERSGDASTPQFSVVGTSHDSARDQVLCLLTARPLPSRLE